MTNMTQPYRPQVNDTVLVTRTTQSHCGGRWVGTVTAANAFGFRLDGVDSTYGAAKSFRLWFAHADLLDPGCIQTVEVAPVSQTDGA